MYARYHAGSITSRWVEGLNNYEQMILAHSHQMLIPKTILFLLSRKSRPASTVSLADEFWGFLIAAPLWLPTFYCELQ